MVLAEPVKKRQSRNRWWAKRMKTKNNACYFPWPRSASIVAQNWFTFGRTNTVCIWDNLRFYTPTQTICCNAIRKFSAEKFSLTDVAGGVIVPWICQFVHSVECNPVAVTFAVGQWDRPIHSPSICSIQLSWGRVLHEALFRREGEKARVRLINARRRHAKYLHASLIRCRYFRGARACDRRLLHSERAKT